MAQQFYRCSKTSGIPGQYIPCKLWTHPPKSSCLSNAPFLIWRHLSVTVRIDIENFLRRWVEGYVDLNSPTSFWRHDRRGHSLRSSKFYICCKLDWSPTTRRDINQVLQNFLFDENWILVPLIKIPLRHFDVTARGAKNQRTKFSRFWLMSFSVVTAKWCRGDLDHILT